MSSSVEEAVEDGKTEETEMGMVDVLVCGGEAEMSRYPADDGGRSQNRFWPITAGSANRHVRRVC